MEPATDLDPKAIGTELAEQKGVKVNTRIKPQSR